MLERAFGRHTGLPASRISNEAAGIQMFLIFVDIYLLKKDTNKQGRCTFFLLPNVAGMFLGTQEL